MSKPTINDVAELAGVSASAVSIYLNKRSGISDETQARIEAAIEELGYIPRQDKRRTSSNGFIGLIVEKLPMTLQGDYFYSDVAQGIQDEAEKLGYSLAFNILNAPPTDLPRIVEEDQVSGILAIGGGDVSDELLNRIDDRNMPLVTVDNQSYTRALNNIIVDNYRGAYLATQHLIELGHQHIAIIRGPEKYKSLTERFHGYLNALFDAGIMPTPSLIQRPISKGIPRKGRLEMLQLLQLEQPPTAVFAVSDRTALGAMDAIFQYGLSVPDDMSLVGFDDMPPNAYPYPPLTTVTSKRYEMGQIAVRRLHKIIQQKDISTMKIVISTELIIRGSTRELGSSLTSGGPSKTRGKVTHRD